MTTVANRWNPFNTTAILNNKEAASVIEPLLKSFKINAYDNRYLRLFRWFSTDVNSKATDKWVEYDQTSKNIQSMFTFEPGRMFWLKTRENVPLHMGSGYTVSLRDSLTIDIPGKQWVDFAMPYRFSIQMEDILSATGKDADSVLVYRWERDSSTGVVII